MLKHLTLFVIFMLSVPFFAGCANTYGARQAVGNSMIALGSGPRQETYVYKDSSGREVGTVERKY